MKLFYLLFIIFILSSVEKRIKFHREKSTVHHETQLKEMTQKGPCGDKYPYKDDKGKEHCYDICTKSLKCKNEGEICRKLLVTDTELYCVKKEKMDKRNKISQMYLTDCQPDFVTYPAGEPSKEKLICLKGKWTLRCDSYQDCLLSSSMTNGQNLPKVTCGPIDNNPFYADYGSFFSREVTEKVKDEVSIFGIKFKDRLTFLAKNNYCIMDKPISDAAPIIEKVFKDALEGKEVDEQYKEISSYLMKSLGEETTLRNNLIELKIGSEKFNEIVAESSKLAIKNIPSLGQFFREELAEQNLKDTLSEEEYKKLEEERKEKEKEENELIYEADPKKKEIFEIIEKGWQSYKEEGGKYTAAPFDKELRELFGGDGKGENLGDYCNPDLNRYCFNGLICKHNMCTTPCDTSDSICKKYENSQIKCTLYNPASSKRYCYDEGFTKRNPNKIYLTDCDELNQNKEVNPESKYYFCYHGTWTRRCFRNSDCQLYRGGMEYNDIECMTESEDFNLKNGFRAMFDLHRNTDKDDNKFKRFSTKNFYYKFCNSQSRENNRIEKLKTNTLEEDSNGQLFAGAAAKMDYSLFSSLNSLTTNHLLISFAKGYYFALMDTENVFNIMQQFSEIKNINYTDSSEIFKGKIDEAQFKEMSQKLDTLINKVEFISKYYLVDLLEEKNDYNTYMRFNRKYCRNYEILTRGLKDWKENDYEEGKKNGVEYKDLIKKYKDMIINMYNEFTSDIPEMLKKLETKRKEVKELKKKELHKICGRLTKIEELSKCYHKVEDIEKPLKAMEKEKNFAEMINLFKDWEVDCLSQFEDVRLKKNILRKIESAMREASDYSEDDIEEFLSDDDSIKTIKEGAPVNVIKEISSIGIKLLTDFCSPFKDNNEAQQNLFCSEKFIKGLEKWCEKELDKSIRYTGKFEEADNNIQLATFNILYEFLNHEKIKKAEKELDFIKVESEDNLARARRIGTLMGFAAHRYHIDYETNPNRTQKENEGTNKLLQRKNNKEFDFQVE